MRLQNRNFTAFLSPQGGSILSFYYRGIPLLGPARPVVVGGETRQRGENHWCAPQWGPGNAEAGWPGQRHGTLRDNVIDVISKSDTEATFRFPGAVEKIGDIVPRVDVALTQEGIATKLTLRNARPLILGSEEGKIPILPAFHPYFAVPMGKSVEAFIDSNRALFTDTDDMLSWHSFSKETQILPTRKSVEVRIGGIGHMLVESTASHVALWSDSPREYVCVEPIFGTPGTYGTPEGLWLGPEEEMSFEVEIKFALFS